MSADWERYSTADEARSRAKKPADNAIVRLPVGPLRNQAAQSVDHTPDPKMNNRAHCSVVGEKDPETRVILARIADWEIPLD